MSLRDSGPNCDCDCASGSGAHGPDRKSRAESSARAASDRADRGRRILCKIGGGVGGHSSGGEETSSTPLSRGGTLELTRREAKSGTDTHGTGSALDDGGAFFFLPPPLGRLQFNQQQQLLLPFLPFPSLWQVECHGRRLRCRRGPTRESPNPRWRWTDTRRSGMCAPHRDKASLPRSGGIRSCTGVQTQHMSEEHYTAQVASPHLTCGGSTPPSLSLSLSRTGFSLSSCCPHCH